MTMSNHTNVPCARGHFVVHILWMFIWEATLKVSTLSTHSSSNIHRISIDNRTTNKHKHSSLSVYMQILWEKFSSQYYTSGIFWVIFAFKHMNLHNEHFSDSWKKSHQRKTVRMHQLRISIHFKRKSQQTYDACSL